MKERRYLPVRELRMETVDGKRFLTGLAAPYNQLSEDLGGWRERIKPGAFSRALREQQDVRHLLNHNPDRVLGRTSKGTTVLSEDAAGLHYTTELGNRPSDDELVESIKRGDFDGCSFAFTNRTKPTWVEESDAKGNRVQVRELIDVDLFDISVVTYPAYAGTTVEARSRCFPEGIPSDVVARNDQPRQRSELRLAAGSRSEIRAITNSGGVLEVVIYGYIGAMWWSDDEITVKRLKQAIDGSGPFTGILVRINSGGGDAFEGIAIYNLLRAQNKPVQVCVDGLAASAASIIAMAGDTVVMGLGSMLMIHEPWTFTWGYADQLRAEAAVLDKIAVSGAEIYAQRTKQSSAAMRVLMNAETWLTAQEAVEQGFATSVGALSDVPAATPDLPEDTQEDGEAVVPTPDLSMLMLYRNAPSELLKRAKSKTRHVDGEDLPSKAFLIVGNENDPSTWKLPVEFASEDKTKKHLRTARYRLPSMDVDGLGNPSPVERLEALCKKHGVAVSDTVTSGEGRLRLLHLAEIR